MNVDRFTKMVIEEARVFLADEDAETLDERAARFVEIGDLLEVGEDGIGVGGGFETHFALCEAGMAYVRGMWLSTILTSLAVVERLIASSLYMGGLDSAVRMRAQDLGEEAVKQGLFTTEMKADFDTLRAIRNGILHFQPVEKWIHRLQENTAAGSDMLDALPKDALKAIHLMTGYISANGSLF